MAELSSQPAAAGLAAAPSRTRVLLAFAAVYLIWGSTYLGIRFAIETIPPFLMSGARHLIAGTLLLLGLRCFQPQTFSLGAPREWRDACIVGFLLLVCGNGGVAWAEKFVPSGLAALLVAVVPLWMILLDWLRPGGQRPAPAVIAGLLLGFAGVWILLQPDTHHGEIPTPAAAYIALALAAFLWAAGSLYSRHAKSHGSPLLAIARQMICGGSLLVLLGMATGESNGFDPASVSARSFLSLLYLALFGSLIGFSSYVWLMKASTPARVSTYAYVNPAIAVLLGWSLGGEALSASLLLGAAIVLASVILVLQKSGGGRSNR